jgi:tight adherence protein B
VRGLAVHRSRQRAYRLAADAVLGLAADLRAGAALEPAWRTAQEALGQARSAVLPAWRPSGRSDVAVVEERILAATSLAHASGAALADVLDRLDAHLRAVDRARAVAGSQAAGARVSAGLLAALPVAGVGLGMLVGVDAWHVLLHTPLGALAVGAALILQFGGLAWAARLSAPDVSP